MVHLLSIVGRRVAVAALLLGAAALPAQRPSAGQMREGDPGERRRWLAERRNGGSGPLDPAKMWALRELRMSAAQGAFTLNAAGERWEPIGPQGFVSMNTLYSSNPMPDEGRFSSVAIHPRNPRIMLAGSAGAGVWRTTNAGASWIPLGDQQCSTSIGSIAMDPVNPNIVYAGTGEQPSPPFGWTDGCGILVSTNMGDTWTRVAGTQLAGIGSVGATVRRVAVDRATAGTTTSTTVFAATSLGLLRSTNSGASWSTVQSGFVTDVRQHPGNAQVWYAAVGNHSGAASNGIYRSTNGGTSWSLISQTLGTPTSLGRIRLAVSAARPGAVWAIIANPADSKFRTLARWDENTGQWTLLAANGIIFQSDAIDFGTQSDWNLTIAVDPVDENRVIIGGVRLFRSRDGGDNFHQIAANVHSDWHSVEFDPSDTRRLVGTCDGGVFTSTDGGTTWRSLNNGIQATMFYPGVAVHPTNPSIVVGGTQDNGSMMSGGSPFWAGVGPGDGGWAMIDYTNPNTVYVSWQFGQVARLDINARTFSYLPPRFVFRAPFITPIIIDPQFPQKLWAGTFAVEQSPDRGVTWAQFSPTVNNQVNAIAVSTVNPTVVFAGTTAGEIFWTPDGGANWYIGTAVQRQVTDIVFDPANPRRFAITHGGFGPFKIITTPNAGDQFNFANLTGNLPDVPVHAFSFTPTFNRFFAGTDIGVFESTDGGVTWSLTPGMPVVPVLDLVYHAATNRMIAATHGRGMWSLPLASPPPVLRGDVDRNGIVNAADALLMQRGLAAIPLPAPLTLQPQGDANCNGALDAADVLVVLRFSVGLGTGGTCVNSTR